MENGSSFAFENQRIINQILSLSLKPISLDELFDQALDVLLDNNYIKLLPRAGIFITESNPSILTLSAHKGFTKEELDNCARLPLGKCYCGAAAVTGKIQFASCKSEGDKIHFSKKKPHGHYCVPIVSRKRILGVITLYVEPDHVFRDEEQDCFLSVAHILAGIIERKRIEDQRAALLVKLHAAVEALLNEKLFTESIIHSFSDGLLALDNNGVITKKNPVAENILTKISTTSVLEGKKLSDIIGEKAAKEMLEHKTNDSPLKNELKLKSLSNEDIIIGYNTTIREDSNKQNVGFVLSFSDITEVKRTQIEMEKMNRLITVAEIASAVAHEVRNPLAGIKTMSQSIEENMDNDDENKEYLYRIIRQVDRLNELLTNFFTYARPGKPKKRKISLEKIVGETKQLVMDKLAGRGIKLIEYYEPDLPSIFGDPNQIQQVFLNLMLNSIDAVDNNGIIEITAELLRKDNTAFKGVFFPDYNSDHDYIKVIFKDNGSGMESQAAERAFDPFFSTKPHGAGLGLAIVHRILNENNSFIYHDSTNKNGASFIIFFEIY